MGTGKGGLQKWSDREKCADVHYSPTGPLPSNGLQLQLWDCNSSPGQSWGQQGLGGNPWYLSESETDASKCMDLEGGNTQNGNPVVVWDCNNGVNQNWTPAPIKTQKARSNVTLV